MRISRDSPTISRSMTPNYCEGLRPMVTDSYERRCAAAVIPNFIIRCRSVLGCKLRIFAAPLGPSTIPPVSRRTALM